jgi:hypothetical protein
MHLFPVHKPRKLLQADLVEVATLARLSSLNDKVLYLLCVIDSYTR